MPLVDEFHGTSGPVHTSFNDTILPLERDFIQACEEVSGISNKPTDPWSGDHIGFYNSLGAVSRVGPNKGKRSYATRGYYEPNRARPNLKVLCEALVNKVILDDNKATGVSLTYGGVEHQVSAQKEVIVCGGTLKSPQILELSGIGDPTVLEPAGVPCKVENLAVGANLQDHSLSFIVYKVKPGIITMDSLSQMPQLMEDAMKQYSETGTGILSSVSTMQGYLPVKTIMSEDELSAVVQSIRDVKSTNQFHADQLAQVIKHLQSDHSANLQVALIPATGNPEGIKNQSKLFPPLPADEPAGFSLGVCLQYPVSRGYVHIGSNGTSLTFT